MASSNVEASPMAMVDDSNNIKKTDYSYSCSMPYKAVDACWIREIRIISRKLQESKEINSRNK